MLAWAGIGTVRLHLGVYISCAEYFYVIFFKSVGSCLVLVSAIALLWVGFANALVKHGIFYIVLISALNTELLMSGFSV